MVLCVFKWKNAIDILKRYGSRHVAMLISIGVYRRCNLIFDAAFKNHKKSSDYKARIKKCKYVAVNGCIPK